MSKPVVLQVGAYPDWDQIPLDAAFEVKRMFAADNPKAFLHVCGPDVRAIATRGELGADTDMITACPRLELISVYGVGFDTVDLETCRKRGIRVTNTPDVLTKDVADLAVAMMMCLKRNVAAADAWVRQGDWQTKGAFPLQQRVHGNRIGILGLGRIGTEIGKRMLGFEMDVAYTARAPKTNVPSSWTYIADAKTLAERSDVLFVSLAASPETRHIVDDSVLTALGPEGILINVSRSANVDENALISALAEGRLGAAALDVFDNEPALDPRLLTLPTVLLQPHHGSGTMETRRAMGQLLRDNLMAHFTGQPLPTPVL